MTHICQQCEMLNTEQKVKRNYFLILGCYARIDKHRLFKSRALYTSKSNDNSFQKRTTLFYCSHGRQTKISDHLPGPCPPASMLALQCTIKCIVKCVAPLNRTIINRPTPPYPRFNVVEVAAGILKMTTLKLGHGDSNAALRMLTTRLRAA